MLKADKLYCYKCKRYTTHNYVGSKCDYEGLGIARAILAVSSLGLSETVGRHKYWQCSKCGDIRKD